MDHPSKLYEYNLLKLFKDFIIACQGMVDNINLNEKSTASDFNELKNYTAKQDRLLIDFFGLKEPIQTPVFEYHKTEITEALQNKTSQEFETMRRQYHQTALDIHVLLDRINKR